MLSRCWSFRDSFSVLLSDLPFKILVSNSIYIIPYIIYHINLHFYKKQNSCANSDLLCLSIVNSIFFISKVNFSSIRYYFRGGFKKITSSQKSQNIQTSIFEQEFWPMLPRISLIQVWLLDFIFCHYLTYAFSASCDSDKKGSCCIYMLCRKSSCVFWAFIV